MGKMRAVMMPRPPALETADARAAVPTCIMPPCTTGTRMPSRRVSSVLKGMAVEEVVDW